MANHVYNEVFPFLEIEEDEFIILNDNLDCDINVSNDDRYKKCDDLNLNTFTYTEYRENDYEGNIDPVIRIISMTASTILLRNLMRHLNKTMDYL